jgi:hypothetical protein
VAGVDASVDSKTRLVFATIVVDNPFATNDEQSVPLVPGLFVDVQLSSPKKIKGIQIPRTALRNGTLAYVYENEKLQIKSVQPIYTSENMVIVSDSTGFNSGSQVITSPVPGAYEGMPLKLPQALSSNESKDLEEIDSADTLPSELETELIEEEGIVEKTDAEEPASIESSEPVDAVQTSQNG